MLTCWRLNVAKVFTPFAGMKYPLSVIMTGMTPKSRMYLAKSDMLPSVWSSRFPVEPRYAMCLNPLPMQYRVAFVWSLSSCSSMMCMMSRWLSMNPEGIESPSPTMASGVRPWLNAVIPALSQQHRKVLARSTESGMRWTGKSPSHNITASNADRPSMSG